MNDSQAICSDEEAKTLESLLVIPEGAVLDVKKFQDVLCQYNSTAMSEELLQLLLHLVTPFLQKVSALEKSPTKFYQMFLILSQVPEDYQLNVTAFLARINSLQSQLQSFNLSNFNLHDFGLTYDPKGWDLLMQRFTTNVLDTNSQIQQSVLQILSSLS